MTKIYDSSLISLKQGQELPFNCPQLFTFDHSVSLMAEARNISREEAITEVLKEFTKLLDLSQHEELKRSIDAHLEDVRKQDQEQENEKEKYPHIYLFEKLNEMMAESMNIPKIALSKFKLTSC